MLSAKIWEKQSIAFPMTLLVGWTKSPLYLCIATETITDEANKTLEEHEVLPIHHLEKLAYQGKGDSTSEWKPPI